MFNEFILVFVDRKKFHKNPKKHINSKPHTPHTALRRRARSLGNISNNAPKRNRNLQRDLMDRYSDSALLQFILGWWFVAFNWLLSFLNPAERQAIVGEVGSILNAVGDGEEERAIGDGIRSSRGGSRRRRRR